MSGAPAQVQEVRRLIGATDADLGHFVHLRRDSVGCITDVVFTVETWRDARGVVRKLRFDDQGLMGTGSRRQDLYRDAQGRPRAVVQFETDGHDVSRPTTGRPPATGTTELLINAAGRVIGRVETGQLKARTPVAWPQVLADLNPTLLFKRYTCQR